jgi:hypothetical protein
MTDTKPWVLLTRIPKQSPFRQRKASRQMPKGAPPQHFETRDAAQTFYDRVRFNGGRAPGATVFGPGGEAWYVNAGREAQWERDDARRRREAEYAAAMKRQQEAAQTEETAA